MWRWPFPAARTPHNIPGYINKSPDIKLDPGDLNIQLNDTVLNCRSSEEVRTFRCEYRNEIYRKIDNRDAEYKDITRNFRYSRFYAKR